MAVYDLEQPLTRVRGRRVSRRTDKAPAIKPVILESECVGLEDQEKQAIQAALNAILDWRESNAIIASTEIHKQITFFASAIKGEVEEAYLEFQGGQFKEEDKELCDVVVFLMALVKRCGISISLNRILLDKSNVDGTNFYNDNGSHFYLNMRSQIVVLTNYLETQSETQLNKKVMTTMIHDMLQAVLQRFQDKHGTQFATEFTTTTSQTLEKNDGNRQEEIVHKDHLQEIFGVTPEQLEKNEVLSHLLYYYFETVNRRLRDVIKAFSPETEYTGMPKKISGGFIRYFQLFTLHVDSLYQEYQQDPEQFKQNCARYLEETGVLDMLTRDVVYFFLSTSAFLIDIPKGGRYSQRKRKLTRSFKRGPKDFTS